MSTTAYVNPTNYSNISCDNPGNVLSNESSYGSSKSGSNALMILLYNYNFPSFSKYAKVNNILFRYKDQVSATVSQYPSYNGVSLIIGGNNYSVANNSLSTSATVRTATKAVSINPNQLKNIYVSHSVGSNTSIVGGPSYPQYRLYISQLAVDYTNPTFSGLTNYSGKYTAGTNPSYEIKPLNNTVGYKEEFEIGIKLDLGIYQQEEVILNTELSKGYEITGISLAHTDANVFKNVTLYSDGRIGFRLNDSYLTGGVKRFNIILKLKGYDIRKVNTLKLTEPTTGLTNTITLPKIEFDFSFDFTDNNYIFTNDYWQPMIGEGGNLSLPCGFEDTNYTFDEDMETWIEKISRYIGPIKLERSHQASVTNNTTNSLIKEQYKNRVNIGKKGDYNEKITLPFKIPYKDIRTLQGLVRMDGPVVLNTCPECPQGDVLNHKGWVVLYGVRNIKRVNNRIYECDLDVEYISRNIKPNVNIKRGARNNTTLIKPNIQEISLQNHEDFTQLFYYLSNSNFAYSSNILPLYNTSLDPEEPNGEAGTNIITLHPGDNFIISNTHDLSDPTNIEFCWENKIVNPEFDYSDVEMIIRIKDEETGESLFEYKYLNLQHMGLNPESDDNSLILLNEVDVFANLIDNIEDEEINLLNQTIDLNYDFNKESYSDYWVGSKCNIYLERHKLNISDSGFSGAETNLDEVELENTNYLIEFEFINKSEHDLTSRVGIEMTENTASKIRDGMYSNMIVSPQPLPNKDLYFYRKTPEGVLYYQKYDRGDGIYTMTPFTQYKCGTNLETSDGSSLLFLETDENPIVMGNTLIRVIFDRWYGFVSIEKYNEQDKSWHLIKTMRMNNIEDIKLITLTNDKIILNVAGTTWTMWRGHPFVEVIHPNRDIHFIQPFDSVWCEAQNTNGSWLLPADYQMLDLSNLLPISIGSLNSLQLDEKGIIKVFKDNELVESSENLKIAYIEDSKSQSFNTYTVPGSSTLVSHNFISVNSKESIKLPALVNGDQLNLRIDKLKLQGVLKVYFKYYNVNKNLIRTDTSEIQDNSNVYDEYVVSKTPPIDSKYIEVILETSNSTISSSKKLIASYGNIMLCKCGLSKEYVPSQKSLFSNEVVPLKDNFYVKLYSKGDDHGLQILRPNYKDCHMRYVPASAKTVIIPYFNNANFHDKPESMAVEYMNLYDQSIILQR